MKLKIRIKEVVEEKRKLTLGEKAIINSACNYGDMYTEAFEAECKAWMLESGYITRNYDMGTFRKETIRDATANEKEAWLNQELNKIGAKISANVIWCAEELRGKEVILEVVE